MAHLYRLIVALCCLLGMHDASALLQPTQRTVYSYGSEPPQDSVLASCQYHWDKYTNDLSYPYRITGTVSPNGATCVEKQLSRTDGNIVAEGTFTPSPSVVSACPINSTAVTGGCACASGFTESGDLCVASGPITSPHPSGSLAEYCDVAKKYGVGWGISGVTSGAVPTTGCYMVDPPFEGADAAKGCAVTLSGSSIKIPRDDGKFNYSADSAATGETCAPGVNSPGTTDTDKVTKDPCPNGYPGTVNGTTVCAKNDPTSGIEGTTTTKETSDGQIKEVKESVKCSGGQCITTTTTTTTSVATGASVTTTNTKEGSAAAACAESKSNPACKSMGLGSGVSGGTGDGGGSFSGNCAAGFKAESEDPVIAAMALEQHKRNCTLFETPSPESQAYDQAKTKTGNQTGDLPGNSTVGIGPSDFDTSDALGGGQCFADVSVDVMGKPVVLTFSKICPYADMLGQVLVAISFLIAAGIVYGKVR